MVAFSKKRWALIVLFIFAAVFSLVSAENTITVDENLLSSTLQDGDVVVMTNGELQGEKTRLVKSVIPYDPWLVGIIQEDAQQGKQVVFSGKAKVKVSTENGSIAIGDYITSSSLSGVGMKADRAGYMIGRALEDYDQEETASIEIFIQLGWYDPFGLPLEEGSSTTSEKENVKTHVSSTIENSYGTLTADRLELAQGKMTVDRGGNISTTGALIIAGSFTSIGDTTLKNIYVLDDITANKWVAPAYDNVGIVLGDLHGVNELQILDSKEVVQASINSEGDIEGNNASFDALHLRQYADTSKQRVGRGTLFSGTTSTFIKTNTITAGSYIFLTAIGSTGEQPLNLIDQVEGNGFTVGIDHPLSRDVMFNYLIIN